MLLIPPFHEALENITEATIELFGTEGAARTAKGAGVGAGFYGTPGEVLSSLRRIETIAPDAAKKETVRKRIRKVKKGIDRIFELIY